MDSGSGYEIIDLYDWHTDVCRRTPFQVQPHLSFCGTFTLRSDFFCACAFISKVSCLTNSPVIRYSIQTRDLTLTKALTTQQLLSDFALEVCAALWLEYVQLWI